MKGCVEASTSPMLILALSSSSLVLSRRSSITQLKWKIGSRRRTFRQIPRISSSFASCFSLVSLSKQDFQCRLFPISGFGSLSPDDDGGDYHDDQHEFLKAENQACPDAKALAFVVVNFYCFVFIEDPQDQVSKHLSFLQGRDIRGRIYLNEQGINAQYSGLSTDALAYVEWLKEDPRFSDILVQISPAINGHSFPRLKLRYKPSLVQLEGGIAHLPVLDPSMRATPLTPSEWRQKVEAINNVDGSSNSSHSRKFILLDVRNGYEWDIGHFHGAHRPHVDCFRNTSFGLSESLVTASDPLASANKENTDVLMYCTGGIRCDIYSVILRQRGFQNLFTLKGGVSHYLEKEGPVEWIGNLFVFDSRLSLPPPAYKPKVMKQGNDPQVVSNDSNFARCYICQSHLSELRHRNCANLDCNRLFLCCTKCLMEMQGCCNLDCKSAPRLRPVLPGHQRYEKWHIYRDMELHKHSVS